MSASNYDVSLRRLFTHEGGYTNHPSDPGGPTISAAQAGSTVNLFGFCNYAADS